MSNIQDVNMNPCAILRKVIQELLEYGHNYVNNINWVNDVNVLEINLARLLFRWRRYSYV